jgi:hypothetical protein
MIIILLNPPPSSLHPCICLFFQALDKHWILKKFGLVTLWGPSLDLTCTSLWSCSCFFCQDVLLELRRSNSDSFTMKSPLASLVLLLSIGGHVWMRLLIRGCKMLIFQLSCLLHLWAGILPPRAPPPLQTMCLLHWPISKWQLSEDWAGVRGW